MMHKKIFMLAVCVLALTDIYAQKKWSLKECVDYAWENNLLIKQAGISADVARVNYNQNFATMFPSLNGSASQSFNYGRSVDPTTYAYTTQNVNATQGSLTADVTIFNGLRLQNLLKQSKLDYEAGKYDIDKVKNDIAISVVGGFLNVLYGQELLKTSNDRIAATKKQRDNIKLQVDAGNLAQGNFLDIESETAQEELQVITAENTLEQAYLTLTQLMNLDSVKGFDVEVPSVTIPDQSIISIEPEAIYATAAGLMPEIKSGQLRLESADKAVDIAKGSYFPRLSAFGQLSTSYSSQSQQLSGSPVVGPYLPTGAITASGEAILAPDLIYSFEKTPFNNQLDQNLNKAFGMSLSVPIFNGFLARSNVERAKLGMKNAAYSLDLQKQNLYKIIQQAHLDAVASLKKYQAAQKSVDAFKLSESYAEKKLTVGLLNTIDYTNVKNNLAKAESDFLQAKYDFIFRIKVLDFYMGKPLL